MIITLSIPLSWEYNKFKFLQNFTEIKERQKIDTGVINLRAMYTTLDYKDYFPLLISFTPRYGNLILEKYYNKKEHLLVFNDGSKNNRNYLYNNRKEIFKNYIKDNNLDYYFSIYNEDIATKITSVIIVKENFSKYFLTIPIFIYRGLFPIVGSSEFEAIYNNFNLIYLKNINFLIHPLSMISIIIIFFYSLFKKRNNIYFVITFIPILHMLAHSSISHNIGRYSNAILPIGLIALSIIILKCINLIKNEK